ncbi:MAG: 1-acyl-sn-glycerol-3-phosphate acyltransferase [Desulfatitalea sp.]|nr:1-acyl-sn-glycerol-3-phosphate acyltransferase [Desulfatitalea sp.]
MSRAAALTRGGGRTLPRGVALAVDLAVTLLVWSYFTAGFVVFFAPFYLLAAALAGDRARAFQWLNHLFCRGFFGLFRGTMPRQQWRIDPALRAVAGAVVVCNHLSYIDPLLLISLFPRHTTIVKNRLFGIPIFGWMLGLSGYLPASSQGPQAERMVRRMEEMPGFLGAGGNLIVFPEGTRSRDGAVGPLNAGAFKIARLCKAPVAVAVIENSQRLFTPGRFRFNTCQTNTITVTLLDRFMPAYESADFSVKILIEQVRTQLAQQMEKTVRSDQQEESHER